MTVTAPSSDTLAVLDVETRLLVRLAAIIATGSDTAVRSALLAAVDRVPHIWVEELILQTYLFAGFPRSLNAAREWRRASRTRAPAEREHSDGDAVGEWRVAGEQTCATVYGESYDKLRDNIRCLHPALESWMIIDGYGKVLSRPGLDLPRRELCVVAVCAAAHQERQLHSHLHGAINAGAARAAVDDTLDAIADLVPEDEMRGYRLLWQRVRRS